MVGDLADAFPSILRIDPKDVFCAAERCTTGSAENLYFRDTTHLTNAGSEFLVQTIRSRLLEHLTGR